MAKLKVLVPYNFTKGDESALDFILTRYRQEENISITLVHVYVPLPKVEVSDKTVMARLMENMAYLRQKINDAKAALTAAGKKLVSAGFHADHVDILFQELSKDVASDIIDLVRQKQFTTVILNRRPNQITRFFTPSVSKKVARVLSDIDIITVV